ncbi:hypothetical protein C7H19_20715 [Aphanothece hegewaldii CCALA 016]|uniref:UPF0367 protein C7H19_20715 n=1 Tax=Aphanothece hegewaldii CCALA 016 TaxID=2107694 RepID=A0A2T1LSR2_9CHRO|nr:hypothetical protein [Aphanothece hegewaldii]PSF33025.1 hypothetical protein C7H19_20715 [Aphanothece hegewaldii CCALA 016]
MYTIDVTLKYSPIPISVQRKEAEGAEALFQSIIAAMRSQSSQLLELTCDKQPDKKVALLSDQISAVIVSEKTGASARGNVPGFFSIAAGDNS